ncbi:MFS transporter [Actinoplanes couchii]|uniref:MFS transporter n=1 Tax=Actinoplanes couchii TaxID=403638 RepID=A0ABQ3XS46_9ACTN|nr:MFS transporter [Actinoplanes couchii]MDR6318767.1 MFS family permease [Actinoplanes couchii]GID61295.1 MFS transporter [Actinoplanes couchii]
MTLSASAPEAVRQPVGPKYIWLMVLASFGAYLAFITPIALSLSLRVEQLAPGNAEYLGYLTGTASIAGLIWSPILGVLSDRTRSRLGRRRPYLLAGAALGLFAMLVMAWAPSVLMLGVGWTLASIGWGTVVSALLYTQADRLPEQQRGKVAGLAGSTQMIAPVLGAGLASTLVSSSYLLMLVPAGVGFLLVVVFVLFVGDKDSRDMVLAAKPAGTGLLRTFVFNPRHYPDFAWLWLGRALFNTGMMLATTFTAFFFADRLGQSVKETAGFVAMLAVLGVGASMIGAIGGGFLSDRLRRRQLFVMIGGILFAVGALLQAFGPATPVLVAGSMIASIGIGTFAALEQALILDVLPERDTDGGRFLGIANYTTGLTHAIAPLIATGLLLVGVTGDDKNYPLVFIVAAICTVAGGLTIAAKVHTSHASPEAH